MNLLELKGKLSKTAGGNTQFLIILLIVVLFALAGLITYRRYVASGLKPPCS